MSRGVLLDVARAQGVEGLAAGYAVTIADLEATEARQGVRVGEGDIVMIRTGQMATRLAGEPDRDEVN